MVQPSLNRYHTISLIIHHQWVQPSHWTETISLLFSTSDGSALSLTRYDQSPLLWIRWFSPHWPDQSPSLFIITWYSRLTDQIPSVSSIIHHHIVQPSHKTDTISLLHYSSSDGSAVSLTRYHQSPSLIIIRWFSPLTEQIPSVSFIIHHHRVQPSHLASHHRSPSLSITCKWTH